MTLLQPVDNWKYANSGLLCNNNEKNEENRLFPRVKEKLFFDDKCA